MTFFKRKGRPEAQIVAQVEENTGMRNVVAGNASIIPAYMTTVLDSFLPEEIIRVATHRIERFIRTPTDESLPHPYDVELACYLWLVAEARNRLIVRLAGEIMLKPNTHIAAQIAQEMTEPAL